MRRAGSKQISEVSYHIVSKTGSKMDRYLKSGESSLSKSSNIDMKKVKNHDPTDVLHLDNNDSFSDDIMFTDKMNRADDSSDEKQHPTAGGSGASQNHDHRHDVSKNVTISAEDWKLFQKQNKMILKQLKVVLPDSGDDNDSDGHVSKADRKSDSDLKKAQKNKKRKNDDQSLERKPEKKRKVIIMSDSDLEHESDVDFDSVFQRMVHSDNDDENLDISESLNVPDSDNLETIKQLEDIFLRNNETGPPVDGRLANLVNAICNGSSSFTDEKVKEKEIKYKRPSNVEFLTVPKVNAEIWAQIDHGTKSHDLKFQKQQRLLLTVANALVFATNSSLTTKQGLAEVDNDIFAAMTSSTCLVLKAIHDISIERRRIVLSSPCLNEKYKALASSLVPITENLFGNLKEAMNVVESSSKLGKSYTQSSKGRKFFPQRGPKNYQDRQRNAQWIRGRGKPYYSQSRMAFGQPARGRGRGLSAQMKKRLN